MGKSKTFKRLCKKYGVDFEKVPEIMTFEDACESQGIDPTKLPVVTDLPERHWKRLVADYKLTIIGEALRQGKNVDYTISDWKYFPVFTVKADKKRLSGFGLSYGDFDYWVADSLVGVRLCFESYDIAKFFGQHFLPLHTDHHLLT